MYSEEIRCEWKQLRRRIRERWDLLSDDDLNVEDGHRDYLVRKLQERYRLARIRADAMVRDFEHTL